MQNFKHSVHNSDETRQPILELRIPQSKTKVQLGVYKPEMLRVDSGLTLRVSQHYLPITSIISISAYHGL